MKIRRLILALAAFALSLSHHHLFAQTPAELPRVGMINVGSASSLSVLVDAFVKGLADQGYVDGRNIIIDRRFANGQVDQLPALAAELVASKSAVIFAPTPQAASAARKVTDTLPIVFAVVQEPVKNGFAFSLARPGGNMTGVTDISADLILKRLELLSASVRKLTRLTVLSSSLYPGTALQLRELERVAKQRKIELSQVDVQSPKELDEAFSRIVSTKPDALLILDSPVTFVNRKQVADFALGHRYPTIFNSGESVEAGGLMSYGAGYPALYRQASSHVAKILRGAKAADLPVEQPTRFELVVNQKTAKALGLTFPPSVLLMADRQID